MSCCDDTPLLHGFSVENPTVGLSIFGRFYLKNVFYTDLFFNLMQPTFVSMVSILPRTLLGKVKIR